LYFTKYLKEKSPDPLQIKAFQNSGLLIPAIRNLLIGETPVGFTGKRPEDIVSGFKAIPFI